MPPRAATPSSARRRSARVLAAAATATHDDDDDDGNPKGIHSDDDVKAGRGRGRGRASAADTQDPDDRARRRVVVAAEYGREGRREHVWAIASPNRGEAASEISRVGEKSGFASCLGRVARSVRAAFLPEGFPESVSDDYLEFQCWDTAQGMCSYVRGSLTTRALLEVRERESGGRRERNDKNNQHSSQLARYKTHCRLIFRHRCTAEPEREEPYRAGSGRGRGGRHGRQRDRAIRPPRHGRHARQGRGSWDGCLIPRSTQSSYYPLVHVVTHEEKQLFSPPTYIKQ